MTTTEPISRGQRKEYADGHRGRPARDWSKRQFEQDTNFRRLEAKSIGILSNFSKVKIRGIELF